MARATDSRRGPATNLGTTLRRRRRPRDPMAEFDRLPAPLRLWLHAARLPWSPRSAARAWARAEAMGEDPSRTLSRMEARRLAQEAGGARREGGDQGLM